MSVTYGFYNAVQQNGVWDREYTAEQLSSIFDGLVNDGVYESVGSKFIVSPSNPASLTVTVGSGRAWFEHTWLLNDAPINVTLTSADASLDRIDAIVIQIDSSARENSITVVQGVLSASPVKPTLTSHQYPLAYVTVTHQATAITAAMIENSVGTSACPFVTGLIQVMSLDTLLAQWNAQWQTWLGDKETETQTRIDYLDTEIEQVEQQVGADLKPIVGYDISLAASAWSTYTATSGTEEDAIYNKGYTYRATIPLANVLPGMRPYVTWSLPSVEDSGITILNQYQCVSGGVYAYADSQPSSAIKVLTLECRKVVTE